MQTFNECPIIERAALTGAVGVAFTGAELKEPITMPAESATEREMIAFLEAIQ